MKKRQNNQLRSISLVDDKRDVLGLLFFVNVFFLISWQIAKYLLFVVYCEVSLENAARQLVKGNCTLYRKARTTVFLLGNTPPISWGVV